MSLPRKKLIEVALPLESINIEAAREKSIRHGHPSTLHLWWARRPLAACRAVLFSSLVDDPSSCPDRFPTEAAQEVERQRLFGIIKDLVKWENSNNKDVLAKAHQAILDSTNGNPPPILDPFCGGGSIPLEAQRLGLEAHGGDLNPVAVLITKALIEIPPKFAGQPPVNPEASAGLGHSGEWPGATGLAADVRYYGKWMRDEAAKRIGHLYPKAQLPKEYGGGEATIIAWIWARTVTCSNPACGARMPLVRSFALSTKAGKLAWVEPVIDAAAKTVAFTIRTGEGKPPEGTVGRRGATCLVCRMPVPLDHVRAEGKAKRMGAQLMAIVAEGKKGRFYLPPTPEQEAVAASAVPDWSPETELAKNPRHVTPPGYGMTRHADLFTKRQLVALTTFSELVSEAWQKIQLDAEIHSSLEQSKLRADAVAMYLALAVSRLSDICNSLCRWENTKTQVRNLFARQAIPMMWDYAEPNVFGDAAGDYIVSLSNLIKALETTPATGLGIVRQRDATDMINGMSHPMICTDPPYYDNVPYADLSDFFYVWLRRSLGGIESELFETRPTPDELHSIFTTTATPKERELVADPVRHGGKEASRQFFEEGMSATFKLMQQATHRDFPLTVFYAFKQAETEDDEEDSKGVTTTASTGWETMLQGMIDAGFQINGTWPIRTELGNRMRGQDSNALASSVVLVCRPRPETAAIATRRQFLIELRDELGAALLHMMEANIAPVDLAQAAIGPGMAVYSRYKKVVETDGEPMRVRAALQLINLELDTLLSSQEGEYDSDTRFCLAWFESFGLNAAPYGDALTLATAKGTTPEGTARTGCAEARAGKVRLLRRDELASGWNPVHDARAPIWLCVQYLARTLEKRGETDTARLYVRLNGQAAPSRDLAYRLYSVCERKGWAQEALAYNSLVTSWPEIVQLAADPNLMKTPMDGLFEGEYL